MSKARQTSIERLTIGFVDEIELLFFFFLQNSICLFFPDAGFLGFGTHRWPPAASLDA